MGANSGLNSFTDHAKQTIDINTVYFKTDEERFTFGYLVKPEGLNFFKKINTNGKQNYSSAHYFIFLQRDDYYVIFDLRRLLGNYSRNEKF